MPPRAAFFAPSHTVALREAVGRVSVELVAPYTPGIPVLALGEEVTDTVLEALRKAGPTGCASGMPPTPRWKPSGSCVEVSVSPKRSLPCRQAFAHNKSGSPTATISDTDQTRSESGLMPVRGLSLPRARSLNCDR